MIRIILLTLILVFTAQTGFCIEQPSCKEILSTTEMLLRNVNSNIAYQAALAQKLQKENEKLNEKIKSLESDIHNSNSDK